MNSIPNVIIIGGGLAGLTSGIHLSRLGIPVKIFEKNSYPRHKVCGEFISNEILPYFEFLGIDISELKPTSISKTTISLESGKAISSNLPLGGFGISRFALDHFLYKKALENGCEVIFESVKDILFKNEKFHITTHNNKVTKATIVLGAFGKRSNLDQKLSRNFIQKKSPWLAVKAHYSGTFPNDCVELHNFKGGYCGVSKVENDAVNICYLADYKTFKQYKNIEEYQSKVLYKNPHLKRIFENSHVLFKKPITISQISFEKKKCVEDHVLMIGDTAGLIHPLCGNGMAMAIHSGKIASELVADFIKGTISRAELEKKYKTAWGKNFKQRIKTGRTLASILRINALSKIIMQIIIRFPFLLPKIIRKTHGKPLIANT